MDNPTSHYNIATISPSTPILEWLADYVISKAEGGQEALSDWLVLLPNRRSCMAFKESLLRRCGVGAMLMPKLQPIGEVDEAALYAAALGAGVKLEHVLRPISQGQRLFAITREIWWQQKDLSLGQMNMEQASRLAQDVIALMDTLDREMIGYDAICMLKPDAFAQHWQESLAVLKHILRMWPAYLERNQLANPLVRRNQLLCAQADLWRQSPPEYPVIAAGSLGTHPATAQMLEVVSHLPKGLVVLPGADRFYDDAQWESVGPTHPQFQIKSFLHSIDIKREPACFLDDRINKNMLSAAFLPAEHVAQWRSTPQAGEWSGTRIDCEHEWEEARVVALLLREALEKKQSAALITHDEALMSRVEPLLNEYGIHPNRAVGKSMLHEPWVHWLMVVIEAASQPYNAVMFLALLKHPLWQVQDKDDLVSRIEKDMFRGMRSQRSVMARMRHYAVSGKLTHDQSEQLLGLIDVLSSLYDCLEKRLAPAQEIWALHRNVAEHIAKNQNADGVAYDLLNELDQSFAALGKIDPIHYAVMLRHHIQMHKWFDAARTAHDDVHLLSPIEARLLAFDRVVLGSMNEGSWPRDSRNDIWLNDAMRSAIGLPDKQAQIGHETHDFWMLAQSGEVFITRAKRVGGAETIESRFLTRLDVYLSLHKGEQDYEQSHYLQWVRQMQQVQPQPCAPPAPNPPQSARVASLSVTELETLMRDPYSAYARHVLGLEALDPIDQDIDAATLGSIMHAILERFVNAVNDDATQLSRDGFMACAQAELKAYDEWPQVALLWRARLEQMASWMVQLEAERRAGGAQVSAESKASAEFGGLQVRARIDRTEMRGDQLAVIDYKTGSVPTASDVVSGYACQLPLEALMLIDAKNACIAALEYWKLGSGVQRPKITRAEGRKEMVELLDFYQQGIEKLAQRYLEQSQPYYAIPVPSMKPKYNDYAQLSRIDEWL